MYKVFLRKSEINDATAFYVKIITNSLHSLGYETTEVYRLKDIKKNDNVLVISLPCFLKVWLYNPWQNITIWFQGIVPEESRVTFKGIKSKWKFFYNRILDFIAVHRANKILFVSRAMLFHYKKVYGYNKKNYFIMPCFNQSLCKFASNNEKYLNPSFVYAGSLAKWQCIDKTLILFSKIKKEIPRATLTILTGERSKAQAMIDYYNVKDVTIKYVPYEKLNYELIKYKYGFLIRDDIEVNNVATPTKMNSYMACGIIPIYSNVIGDFQQVFSSLKYKVEVTSEDNITLKSILKLESANISAQSVYDEYCEIFHSYYSEDYYQLQLIDFFKSQF